MSTYWVRSSGGSNSNSGLSYALAKATLTGVLSAISGGAGHTINIVAEGEHAMEGFPTTAATSAGTNFTTSPGLVIQGTDASGNPALATATASVGAAMWLRVSSTANYIIVKGIKFKYSALLSTAGAKNPILFEGNVKYHRVVDCECWFTDGVGSGYTLGTVDLPLFPNFSGASGASAGEIETYNCVVVNCRAFSAVLSSAGCKMHHNVIIYDADTSASSVPLHSNGAGTPSSTHQYYNNTYVQIRHRASATEGRCTSAFSDGATDRPVMSCYNNLIYSECSSAATSPGVSNFLLQGVTQTVSSGGTVGYNYFAVGTRLSTFIAAGWNNQTQGYSSYQLNEKWRAGDTAGWRGTDVGSTDTAQTSAAFLDVFKDVLGYTWSPNEYDHVLPYDLRPIVGRTSSTTGGVVGAIDDAIIVDVPPDTTDPDSDTGKLYLDSYPFYKPLFKATMQTMVRVRKNRTMPYHTDMRHYLTDYVHDESTSRCVSVAASGVFECNFGGVYRATGVLLETDQPLSVVVTHFNGVSDSTFTVSVTSTLVLCQCAVTSMVITNTSTVAATVQMVAFD